jgi:hypothetical protein
MRTERVRLRRRTHAVAVCGLLVVASATATAGRAAAARTAVAAFKPIAGALSGVSCPTRTFCLAAGYRTRSDGNPAPLLMRWDGSVWSKITLPIPAGLTGAQFAGVSCPTSHYCIAVGSGYSSGTHFVPISARWDGAKAHYLTQHARVGDPIREDLAVDCASKSFCMAVGRAIPQNNATRPLVEVWNGTAWRESAVDRPKGTDTAEFLAVSCPSTDRCIATGDVVIEMVTKRGVGEWHRGRKTAWKVKPGGNGTLTGVDCSDTSHCYAVGYRNDKGILEPIAQTVDGTSSMTNPGLRTGAATEGFTGLSCLTSGPCFAIGDWTRTNHPGDSHFNLDAWSADVAWRAVHAADPQGAQQTFPQAVSCPTKKFCAGVGYYFKSNAERLAFALEILKPLD